MSLHAGTIHFEVKSIVEETLTKSYALSMWSLTLLHYESLSPEVKSITEGTLYRNYLVAI